MHPSILNCGFLNQYCKSYQTSLQERLGNAPTMEVGNTSASFSRIFLLAALLKHGISREYCHGLVRGGGAWLCMAWRFLASWAGKHKASDKQTGNGTELQRRLPGFTPSAMKDSPAERFLDLVPEVKVHLEAALMRLHHS